MDEKDIKKQEIRKEKKKQANKKYYDKQQEIIKEQENISVNNKECPKKELIKMEETTDWIWDTTMGGIQMVGSTIFQVGMALTVPIILTMIMGKRSNISPIPQSRQEETPIQPQITSLNLL